MICLCAKSRGCAYCDPLLVQWRLAMPLSYWVVHTEHCRWGRPRYMIEDRNEVIEPMSSVSIQLKQSFRSRIHALCLDVAGEPRTQRERNRLLIGLLQDAKEYTSSLDPRDVRHDCQDGPRTGDWSIPESHTAWNGLPCLAETCLGLEETQQVRSAGPTGLQTHV